MARVRGAPSAEPDDATDDDRRWRRPQGTTATATGTFSIAMVALQGIVLDEARSFQSVLAHWPRTTWLTVGRRRGPVNGVGGIIAVDTEFDEIDRCDVLIVPGAIGSEAAGATT